MYIKNIKLTNYRNYESLDLDLGKKTTLLIGKNGSGKTNLINAMKQALSFIFKPEKDTQHYQFLLSLNQKMRVFRDIDSRYAVTQNGLDFNYPVSIQTSMSVSQTDELLEWGILKENAIRKTDLTGVSGPNAFWKNFPYFDNLPIFAYYSAAFPLTTGVMGKSVQDKLDFVNNLPRNHGYYKWDEVRDCIPVWKELFSIRWWNNLIESNPENSDYIKAINECLVEFSRPLEDSVENRDIELNQLTMKPLSKQIFDIVFDFKNNHPMTFSSLPEGYNRIFSIIFDIANRSYLLNRHCNPEGIVFIDEIDAHLHPSIAQEIMERLQRSFPKLQFIVTTHSPLVISNFKRDEDNIVYKLTNGKRPENISNSYGIDYNTLLSEQMETPIRNSFLRELSNAYKHWKEKGDSAKMERVLRKIIDRVGEDSVFVQNLKK